MCLHKCCFCVTLSAGVKTIGIFLSVMAVVTCPIYPFFPYISWTVSGFILNIVTLASNVALIFGAKVINSVNDVFVFLCRKKSPFAQ